MHNNKTQEKRDTKNFPQGNHKGENPTTSSEIESAQNGKTKKQQDDLLTAANSLSHTKRASPVSLMHPNE